MPVSVYYSWREKEMPRVRVYVDTSIFGGMHDREFADASSRFFELVAKGEFLVLVSPQTTRELEGAPEPVRQVVAGLPEECTEYVDVDEEVEALADAYVAAGVLSSDSRDDAVHVAAATVAGAHLILSWNFRDLVRFDRIRMFNGVNALKGYRPVDIRSPLEVSHGGREEDV